MKRTPNRGKADRELAAIGTILASLDELDGESIQRVLDYVLGRLAIGPSTRGTSMSAPTLLHFSGHGVEKISERRQKSIRDLRDEKQPDNLNQMAALVAFYLSELAPENERSDSVSSIDLEKYFKQAGFKLPKSVRSTLPNAAAAGYFNSLGGGRYRLNPVGYNLVVHGLPRDATSVATRPKRRKQKARRKR